MQLPDNLKKDALKLNERLDWDDEGGEGKSIDEFVRALALVHTELGQAGPMRSRK